MTQHRASSRARAGDQGAILPIVLVATVIFTMIVTAVAGLVTTGLRYANVVETRADLLAASDGGLRYGIERLRNFEDMCTTKKGTGGGNTTIFPPTINGASTSVTCRRVAGSLSDLQGWGVVVTGANVPSGQDIFVIQGAGGSNSNIKKLRGPVYVNDLARMDFKAKLIIDDGDLHAEQGCTSSRILNAMSGDFLAFEPSFLRGLDCNSGNWTALFGTPSRSIPTAQALLTPPAFDDISFPGCRIFSPGKYSGPIPLSSKNYFKSGDYYFENVPFTVFNKSATFGFPSGSGDTQKIANPACDPAMNYDRNISGGKGGATLWLGGISKINVDTGGQLEIFRRQQTETYMSVFALDNNGTGFVRSAYSYKVTPGVDWILETKSGNTNDVAIHGLFYTPFSKVTLGNITNSANGQLVGGLVVAQLDVQASASANQFAIGVEGNPVEASFLLESKATLGTDTTTIRAVVQYRPDSRALAVNSWRVAD